MGGGLEVGSIIVTYRIHTVQNNGLWGNHAQARQEGNLNKGVCGMVVETSTKENDQRHEYCKMKKWLLPFSKKKGI